MGIVLQISSFSVNQRLCLARNHFSSGSTTRPLASRLALPEISLETSARSLLQTWIGMEQWIWSIPHVLQSTEIQELDLTASSILSSIVRNPFASAMLRLRLVELQTIYVPQICTSFSTLNLQILRYALSEIFQENSDVIVGIHACTAITCHLYTEEVRLANV